MKKFLCAYIFIVALSSVYSFAQENYVILVSLDGFRHDYIEKHGAKNLQNLAKKGVRVKKMVPSNPTKTFPNHYTLVTGLYPDHHGLIGNYFYAPDLNKEYSLRNRESVEDGRFYGGEPIWSTAKKSGLKSASYFWIGTEAKIDGIQPDLWKKYDKDVNYEQRVDSIISWLELPKLERPRLVLLYFDQPDGAGHEYGPDGEGTTKTVRYVDKVIGNLYNKLMQLPIADKINLLIVSDHGMRKITKDKQVILNNLLKKEWIEGIYGSNPVFTIKAKKGKEQLIYKTLKKNKNLNVYRRNKAPRRLHLAKHERTNDLIVIAKPEYSVLDRKRNRTYNGAHGYLNNDDQMNTIFIAVGNAFKNRYVKNRIKNVDVYNLIAHILNITPAPNDGKFNRVKRLLKKK